MLTVTLRGLLSVPGRLLAWLALTLIAAYKYFISPLLGERCRFYPSCSEYAQQAIARHGAGWGGLLTLWRLVRCAPYHPGGVDYVPEQLPRLAHLWHNCPCSSEHAHQKPMHEPSKKVEDQ